MNQTLYIFGELGVAGQKRLANEALVFVAHAGTGVFFGWNLGGVFDRDEFLAPSAPPQCPEKVDDICLYIN